MSDTYDLVDVLEEQVPTVVSYDLEKQDFVVGKEAKQSGVRGFTNVYNFKHLLGEGEAAQTKQRYWISPTGTYSHDDTKMLSAYEAARIYIKKTIDELGLPGKMVIGIPAIPKQSWKDNYRASMRKVFRELEFEEPLFFPEPFSVYNSYRKNRDYIDSLKGCHDVLALDIGGSTFDSCVIRSNKQGELSGSGTFSRPLGVESSFDGGVEVDKKILSALLEKQKLKGVSWKEDPLLRAEGGRHPVLMFVEQEKLKLSRSIGLKTLLSTNVSARKSKFNFPKSWLHQDIAIEEYLDGEEFKKIIKWFWEEKWIKVVKNTLESANSTLSACKIKQNPLKISRIIIAGGSSQLPFFKELVGNYFRGQVRKKDILYQEKLESTVAYGLAYECKVKAEKEPLMVKEEIAPCLLSELYFGVKMGRREQVLPVKIKSGDFYNADGKLGLRPLLLEDHVVEFDIELPFSPAKTLYYGFYSEPISTDPMSSMLNIGNEVVKLGVEDDVHPKGKLKIKFDPSGEVEACLEFKGKKARAKQGFVPHHLPKFEFTNLDLHEGDVFYGFDFGNSNSYLVKLHAEKKEGNRITTYPQFRVNSKILRKLQCIEQKVICVPNKINMDEAIRRYASYIRLDHVYHSNKLELSPLSYDESNRAIKDDSGVTKYEKEAKNLADAYDWMVENACSLYDSPELFIKELNKKLLNGISSEAGRYRSKSVRITDARIIPPQGPFVPEMMQLLSEELKDDHSSRSSLELAVAIHTKLAFIHPFGDGNGRTARLLMNAVLISQHKTPLIVDSKSRSRYISSLDAAADGDFSMLVNFFLDEKKASDKEFKTYIEDYLSSSKEGAQKDVTRVQVQKTVSESNIKYKAKQKFPALVFRSILPFVKYSADIFCARQPGVNVEFTSFDFPNDEYFDVNSLAWSNDILWYFTVKLVYEERAESYLFYFDKITALSAYKSIGVGDSSVCIARWDGAEYIDLSIEPITIRDVNANKDGVVLSPGPNDLAINSFVNFFSEVYESYLK